jgi:hypothetical protein
MCLLPIVDVVQVGAVGRAHEAAADGMDFPLGRATTAM